MPSFSLTGVSTQTTFLSGGEYGVIATQNAGIVTTGVYTLRIENSTSTLPNTLILNGFLINSRNGTALDLYQVTELFVTVGPTGLIQNNAHGAVLGSVTGTLTLNNAGTITSTAEKAIRLLEHDGSMFVNLTNSGLIDGPAGAVEIDNGIGTSRIINSGTILSSAGTAMILNDVSGSFGSSVVQNTGTIAGTFHAIDASAGNGVTVIYNSGLIDGHIQLGGGSDQYEGGNGRQRGTVFGQDGSDVLAGGAFSDRFDGGAGADTLVGRDGDDRLVGGPDDDFLVGGAGNDAIDGDGGNDTLIGNAGDDSLSGGAENDLIVGQDGSDLLDGGADNDTMDGGSGNDILEGGTGADILRGRAGEDDLAGGEGFDLLTGGQDADSFVFRALSDTAAGALRDQILDFEQGLDLIIVSGLHPGVFEFRGTAAFAPSGNPELRLFETPSGSTIVQIDADGNGIAEAEIRVANVTGLTAEDFVL